MKPSRFPNSMISSAGRAISGQVFVLCLISLSIQSPWVLLFVSLDFALRAFIEPRASYTLLMATRILVHSLRMPAQIVAYAPHRFAAGLGFLLTAGGGITGLLGIELGYYTAVLLVTVFSGLEAFFEICPGCALYRLFGGTGKVAESAE